MLNNFGTILLAFAVVGSAFKPNKGPECTLTCRNRVPVHHCPSFHYVGGKMKTCSSTQYGCIDSDGDNCGGDVNRPPLCVVDGPCHAGPTGCLEDKTGADDGLPPGKYVGHCPEPKSPSQMCDDCAAQCSHRHPAKDAPYQACLKVVCARKCPPVLLARLQHNEAKHTCTEIGYEFGDIKFQACVKEQLNGTLPQALRCGLQFQDTELYCTGMGYTRGALQFQGCVKASFDGICSEEYRCAPQFKDARKYCIKQTSVIGSLEFQTCISDQLADICPKDVGCKKRHTDAREFCKKEGDGHVFGSPDFQDCVARMLDPSCPKDFGCDQRKRDTAGFCKRKNLQEGSPEYSDCLKEALDGICADLSLLGPDDVYQKPLEL